MDWPQYNLRRIASLAYTYPKFSSPISISRILKLRNQLLLHQGNKIRSKDPKNLKDISRKGFSTGLSYMNSCLSEVFQWCKTVDYFRKKEKNHFDP